MARGYLKQKQPDIITNRFTLPQEKFLTTGIKEK
jgi:hypothetical protein